MKRFHIIMTVILITLLSTSCGGGTSGTGLSNYEGQLKDVSGTPIPDATVTLLESGSSDITDVNGTFVLESEPLPAPPTILIETSEGDDSTVQLQSVPEENERLHLEITLDQATNSAEAVEFKVSAAIVGYCDSFFENRTVIRQAVQIPNGQECILKVIVEGEGVRRGGIPVGLQVKACTAQADWLTIAQGETDGGLHRGVAQVPFVFRSSQQFCQYRVVAPLNYKGYEPTIYPFQTFAEQRFTENRRK